MPPGGDKVGEARVDIHVNAGPGEAELAALKSKVDRDFAELSRKKAEAELTLKAAEFDKKIDEAKGKLDYFKSRRATATLDLAKKHFDEQVAAAEAELKALSKQRTSISIDSKQLRAANKEQRLLSEARRLDERVALQQAKAERMVSRERQRATDDAIKSRAEIARLSESYEKLIGKQRGLEKSSRRVFSGRSLAVAEQEARKLERVASEADHVKHRIEQLGGSVDHLDPQISRNSSLLDRWLSKLGDTTVRLGPITTSIKGLGVGLGLLGPLLFELGGGVVSLAGTLGEGLAGGAVVATGALGGLATSAAGVGFVIAPMVHEFKEVHAAAEALTKAELKYGKGSEQVKTAQERLNNELHGVSPIAKEAFEDYGNLTNRWKALTKAARPAVFNAFGESLKTVQSLLPEFARESTATTKVAGKAWDSWMKSLRSSEAKKLLGNIMSDFRASIPGLASGLGSLVAIIGRLGAAGAHFLPGLSNGFAEWANNLEKAVGGGAALQSDVGRLVSQMQDLGHLTQDTGSLIVHIFDAGANSGQGMVKSLDNVIKRWDKWTQSASGKAGLAEFFGDSKEATEDFMSSLAHLTKLLFEFSRATAPLANGLLKVVTFIGDIISAADGLVGVKQIFQGIGIVLAGLFVASKVLTYADSIKTVSTRLAGYVGIETTAVAATEAEAVASAEAAAAMEAEAGAAATAAAALEAEAVAAAEATVATEATAVAALSADAGLGAGAAAATRAALGFGEAEAGAGLLAAALAPEVLIPAAVIAGLVTLGIVLGDTGQSIQDVEADFRKAGHEIDNSLTGASKAIDKYAAAQQHNASASKNASEARAHLVKLQKEGAPADKVTKAVEALTHAERQQARAAHQTGAVNREQIDSQKALLTGARNRVKTAREEIKTYKERIRAEERMSGPGGGTWEAKERNKLAKSERDLAQAMLDVSRAQRQEAATAVPYARSIKDLKPISAATERGLHKLAETIGATATKKIGSFVNPKDVAKVTELGNKLTNLGRGGQVKNIAVKSQGADQTIAKLQKLQAQTNKVEATRANIKVGANDQQAQAKLKRLAALSQRVTGTKNTVNILARSESAEAAIRRLKAHLRDVAHDKYQAEIKALDKATTPAERAHHNMRRAVDEKYSARLEAIDNASGKAKKAEGAGKSAAKQHYKLNITATNQQALNSIQAVNAALSGLHDKTVNVNVITHKSGGYSGGTADTFYSTFASGGLNDRELQRANEKAIRKQSGPSQRINKPTMLVGEQAPQHHEYVIATNPAYRGANERYLDQAASDLGYEVVPAYKKGKGKGKKGSGSGSGAKGGPGPHPPKLSKRVHHYLKATRLNYGDWLERYNATEKNAESEEGHYSAELSHEEREIAAGRMENWNYGLLRGYKENIREDERKLLNPIVPHIEKKILNQQGKAEKALKGTRSRLSQVSGTIGKLENEYSKMEKSKSESTKDYNTKKRQKKHQIDEWKKQQAELKKARKHEEDLIKEAKQELAKFRGEVPSIKDALSEAEDDVQYITDVETGTVEAPYETGGGAGGKEGPSIGEQTASYNEAREQLYEQFASNITGQTTPAAAPGASSAGGGPGGPSTFAVGAPGGQPNYLQKAISDAIGRTGGHPNYIPGGSSTRPSQKHGGASDDWHSAAGGTKIEVVNHFAAPPPDPHTWTKQQEFELGALS
jgi:hypothetical protein